MLLFREHDLSKNKTKQQQKQQQGFKCLDDGSQFLTGPSFSALVITVQIPLYSQTQAQQY